MFFITYTVACLIPDRITQVGNYLTTTEEAEYDVNDYLCSEG